MRKQIYLLFLVLLFNACVGADASYKEARALFSEQSYEDALIKYQEFVDNNPNDERVDGAIASIAWCYYVMGKYDKSIEALTAVNTKDEKLSGWADYIRANCYFKLGAYKEAADAFAKITKSFKNASWIEAARWKHIVSLIKLEKFDEAKPILNSFIEDYPLSDRAREAQFYNIKIASSKLDDNEVLSAYDTLIKQGARDKLLSKLHAAKGAIYLKQKDFKAASQQYKMALNIEPSEDIYPEVLYNYAFANEQLGNTPLATKSYLDFRNMFSQHKLALKAEAYLIKQGVLDTSKGAGQIKLVSIFPESAPAYTNKKTVQLKGFVMPDTKVVIDGEQVSVEDESFQKEIRLIEGDNLVTIEADGPNGVHREIKRKIVLDTVAPIIKDFDASLDDNDYLEVSGKTEPGAKVTINEKVVTVDPEGGFRDRFMKIRRPVNQELKLALIAKDEAGNMYRFEFEDTDPPDAPRNLTARDVTADYIILEWRDNTEDDMLGYDVFYTVPGGNDRNHLNDRLVKDDDFTIDSGEMEKLRAESVGGQIELYIVAVDKRGNESSEGDHLRITLP